MALRRVFTYLGAIFLMSYIIFCNNVSAIDLTHFWATANVYKTPQWIDAGTGSFNSWYTDGSYRDYNYATNGKTGFTSLSFRQSNGSAFPATGAGNYYHFLISVNGYSDAYLSGGFNANDTVSIGISTTDVNCPIVDFDIYETHMDDASSAQALSIRYTVGVTCQLVSTTTQPTINLVVRANANNSTSRFTVFPSVALRFGNDYSLSQINTAINNLYSVNNDILSKVNEIADAQEQVTDATNQAVEDSQNAGESSTSDAQTGTASLISTIGSAVSTITSASPTNCLLNGNMGNFDMGQIDLCSNPVPAFVQIIGSLILILVTVPLCIVLFNRFIGLFRSFQG